MSRNSAAQRDGSPTARAAAAYGQDMRRLNHDQQHNRYAYAFICPYCGMVSHNPNDKRQRYCGRCHVFIDDALELRAQGSPAQVAYPSPCPEA